MNARCHDCAFFAGTDAAACAITRVLALACLRSRGSFDCHVHSGPCAGFEEAKANIEASGVYERQPAWRAQVFGAIADAIVNARDHADCDERFIQAFMERLEEIG